MSGINIPNSQEQKSAQPQIWDINSAQDIGNIRFKN